MVEYFINYGSYLQDSPNWLLVSQTKNAKFSEGISVKQSQTPESRCIIELESKAVLMNLARDLAPILKKASFITPNRISYDNKGRRVLFVEPSISLLPYR